MGSLKHDLGHLESTTWQAIKQNQSERLNHVPLVVLNPLLEILVQVIDFFMCDFKVNAMCKQLDKFHKMVVIVFIQEAAFKKHSVRVMQIGLWARIGKRAGFQKDKWDLASTCKKLRPFDCPVSP